MLKGTSGTGHSHAVIRNRSPPPPLGSACLCWRHPLAGCPWVMATQPSCSGPHSASSANPVEIESVFPTGPS